LFALFLLFPLFLPMNGILNINKPAAWTSFDAVKFIRSRCGERRVGHAGTLDPAATGVLPVLIGQATRMTEYLVDATKTYLATVELGIETDTYDAEGDVIQRADASMVKLSDIERALPSFLGEQEQKPPLYSALKRDGVPLYKRARAGEAVAVEPRRVRTEKLEILAFESPRLRLLIECGKGFYVRSLAHDLGKRLGVGGTLVELVRSRVGPFLLDDAVDLETLQSEFETEAWQERLVAQDEVLLHRRAAILGSENQRRLLQGQSIRLAPEATINPALPGELCRAYSAEGDFLAVVNHSAPGELRPAKVFTSSSNG
jgi:tRNA pseudouridine55 synthase